MLTVTEFARRNKVTRSWIHQLIQANRLRGAYRVGGYTKRGGLWLIPENAKILPARRT